MLASAYVLHPWAGSALVFRRSGGTTDEVMEETGAEESRRSYLGSNKGAR